MNAKVNASENELEVTLSWRKRCCPSDLLPCQQQPTTESAQPANANSHSTKLQRILMANSESPDVAKAAAALDRLDKLDTDTYIVAFGPNGRQFLAAPNGYSA